MWPFKKKPVAPLPAAAPTLLPFVEPKQFICQGCAAIGQAKVVFVMRTYRIAGQLGPATAFVPTLLYSCRRCTGEEIRLSFAASPKTEEPK